MKQFDCLARQTFFCVQHRKVREGKEHEEAFLLRSPAVMTGAFIDADPA